MIEKVIEWSLKNRFLVLCGALLLVVLGIRAVRLTPVDAIPDLTENQVLVFADWMGRSPQEVEDQVIVHEVARVGLQARQVELQHIRVIRVIRVRSNCSVSGAGAY